MGDCPLPPVIFISAAMWCLVIICLWMLWVFMCFPRIPKAAHATFTDRFFPVVERYSRQTRHPIPHGCDRGATSSQLPSDGLLVSITVNLFQRCFSLTNRWRAMHDGRSRRTTADFPTSRTGDKGTAAEAVGATSHPNIPPTKRQSWHASQQASVAWWHRKGKHGSMETQHGQLVK